MESEPPKPKDNESLTKVIEFYVPERHEKATRFIPQSLRGRLIEFPAALLKKPA